jgi:O-antigen/teichoic acid export membrane protein
MSMSQGSLKKSTIIEVSSIRILVVVFQLVFLKIYSNYTSAYELGIFYFLLTASYSLNAFLLVPLDYFQQSQLYLLKNAGNSLRSFFPINKLLLRAIAILLIISNVVCCFIKPAYCLTISVIILLALSTYGVTLLRGIINNLEHRRKAIYCLLLEYVLKVVFFYIYIHFYPASAATILISLLSASVFTFFILFFLFVKLPEFKFKGRKEFDLKDIFHFSYPISISSVINWIQLQSYSLILVPLGLTEVVGTYATIANVGSGGMNAYSTIFSQLFVPNLYKTNGAYIKIYLRNALLSILGILIGGALFSHLIINLLTKHDFAKYAIVIVYGIACEGGNFLISALTIYLTLHNITKVTVKMSFIGLITFLIAFFVLYWFKAISIYTVGIPMVMAQVAIALGLVFESKKIRDV